MRNFSLSVIKSGVVQICLTAVLFALVALLIVSPALAADSASGIRKATVFLSGAELTRGMAVELKPGKNTVTFGGLPSDIQPESVAAAIEGEAQLISAVYRINHLESPEGAERIKKLNEEFRSVGETMARSAARVSVLEAEADFLMQNRSIAGRNGIQLDELREVSEYYRVRLAEIADEKLNARYEQEELQKRLDRLAQQLGGGVDDGRRAVGEIAVELFAAAATRAEVSVSYFVHSAGWTPFYEIRAADTEGPIRLIGKGNVRQATGEDWRDVEVVLSSGTPAIGGTQPVLSPWYLDFAEPKPTPRYKDRALLNQMPTGSAAQEGMMASPLADTARKNGRPVAVQAQTSVEFVLPSPISVPSQEEPQVVEIMNEELAATYQHYSVRKLDRDVFLLAKVNGWEKLSLLAGEASIFLGNTYVGTTYIDPRRADEVLEVSLGRDSGVIVTRVKGRDFAGRSLLGNSDKVTREWVITARNTRKTPIDIRVLDQIPVSTNKDITVEAAEVAGAKHNTATGELSWEFTLQPGGSVQKAVKYIVTYPHGKSVTLE